MVLNSAVLKEGLGRGKLNPGGLRCRAEQEQQTKRKNGQCFVLPQPGDQPGDQATLLASFAGLFPCLLLCIFYSFLLLKDE